MVINLEQLESYVYLGNGLNVWLTALVIFIVVLLLLRIVRFIIIKAIKPLAKKTKTDADDVFISMIESYGWLFYVFISLYFGFVRLNFSAELNKYVNAAFLTIVMFYLAKGFHKVIDFGTNKVIKRSKNADNSSLVFIKQIVKGLLWVVVVLLVISNLGYDITSLIAALGIGGIAVAFALQNVLGDLFASLAIHLDKPFRVGHFIIIGDHLGVVKKIGIKTTRIESLWGEEIVVSNSELTSTRIRNFKRMEKRRIHFTFGVTYQTTKKKLEKIPKIIEKIFGRIKITDLDRVHFKEYGESSLNFEVAYYIDSKEYNDYMDAQQEINLAIKEQFEKENIEFAYPTRTIYLEK